MGAALIRPDGAGRQRAISFIFRNRQKVKPLKFHRSSDGRALVGQSEAGADD